MSNDQNLVFRVAGQGPTWNVLNGEGDIGHSVILGSTRRGKSALLQAEAYRLGISYEELERRLEPTAEQTEITRMKQEEKDRREAARLDAVRKAYWDNTDKSDPDLSPLISALDGLVAHPTVEQQRILFMMLPADVFGQGVSWGFSDTEVRGRIYEFVTENRDAVAAAVSAR
ncbi:hypothetical protein ACO2TQ_40020 [Burkholderia sp. OKR4-1]|uniref:hypothetical protein n=1 Tax=Burkholderia TaxID=32008 RepID=UPI0024C123F4|nr:hypothetical protein [Burkholderia contaminans]MDK0999521.1 hypothetical protein [Burkholderia contaminans]